MTGHFGMHVLYYSAWKLNIFYTLILGSFVSDSVIFYSDNNNCTTV